jgi:8-oxo-dGTP pyrophosphatase MutT (NUDIX family)
MQKAAVLVPVYRRRDGALMIVMVKRSDRGVHGGQIAFPGGMSEAGDGSLLETALREAHEETGIDPGSVEVLAELPVVETMTTGIAITPFLARIVPPPSWKRNKEEIDEIIEVPVRDLLQPRAHGETLERVPDYPEPVRFSFYRIGNHRVWGATYRILDPLLPRLVSEEREV